MSIDEMDDGDLLKQAMMNVAMNNFMKELRESVVFGPKILGDVYAEYQKLMEKKNENSPSS